MKVHYSEDEWYPVPCISDYDEKSYQGDVIDIPEELVNRYKGAMDAFNKVASQVQDEASRQLKSL